MRLIAEQDLVVESKRKLAAIMLTDLVGYTAAAQRDESGAMRMLERHRSLLRPLFKAHKGREVKTIGDAFLVEFESALDATLCAVEIQKTLAEYDSSSNLTERIELRVGVHVGDVLYNDGDILGDAVNVVSRVEPLAEPGGVCLTQQVFDQVRNKVAFTFSKMPPKPLKNVIFKTDVYSVDLPWKAASKTEVREDKLDRRRVAVLPFANMISDPTDEYFADGMTEELISSVSRITELSVISRTSIMRYKNNAKSAIEIGEELNAGTLLEGSVRKAGRRVRVSVKIIDVKSDRHLWAENFDRTLEDIFSIQSEIADQVATILKAELLQRQKSEILKGPTKNVEAHTLYLKGRYEYHKLTRSSLLAAAESFQKAIEIDPSFALAYCELANCYSLLGFFEMETPDAVFPKARLYASQAIEMDSSLPEAHVAVGLIMFIHEWNFAQAEREYRRAIELNPSSASAHLQLSNLLENVGRFDEAIGEVNRALELDPISPQTLQLAGTMYLYARRYDEAALLFRRVLELETDNPMAHDNLGVSLVMNGLVEEGMKEIEKAIHLSAGSNHSFKSDLALAYERGGREEMIEPLLGEAIELYRERKGSATTVAMICAVLGRKDETFEWLGKAFDEHAGYLISTYVELTFDKVRSDPRFLMYMKQIGLVQ